MTTNPKKPTGPQVQRAMEKYRGPQKPSRPQHVSKRVNILKQVQTQANKIAKR